MTGRILAVCLVHKDIPAPGKAGKSAIDKRPVDGPVIARSLGLDGDHQCNTHVHGGVDKAVYAYAEEDARRWQDELRRDMLPGSFGENLRMEGVACSDAVIGSRWAVGGSVLEVVGPRTPCSAFQMFTGEDNWVKRFSDRGDTGTYLRVVKEGPITAGDAVTLVHVPAHGATNRDVFHGLNVDRLERLLAEEPTLSDGIREKVERHLARES
ncbi:MOSC domain-containing protein [Smaragdicoccus niigatensis]|uniref:MOSC domain-containing protein n=1 Tax=Smaragdicoccus niigatensis TaxID=359359 RepID=UPI00035FFD90|nr:MOSC domain-containing protein [Smaragdicoccus niigatensis]